jgi:hypothetical protein
MGSGTGTPTFFVSVAEANSDTTFAGDNSTVSFWVYGANVTEGAFPRPYISSNGSTIPVGGTTATHDITSSATTADFRDSLVSSGVDDTDGIAIGTMLVEVVPRFAFTLNSTSANIITLTNSTDSLLYASPSADDWRAHDGTQGASANSTDADPTGDGTVFRVMVRWDSTVVAPTTGKLQVSDSRDGGVTWLDGTATDFDGGFALGNTLYIGYSNNYPFEIRKLMFFDEWLSWDEANMEFGLNRPWATLLLMGP